MKKINNRLLLFALSVALVIVGMVLNAHHVAAQGDPKGPPGGLGVQVLNTPLPVTGAVTTTITGTVNAKIVSTPFFQSSVPTCDVLNRCFVKFPAVPAGKRLRVTRIHGAMYLTNAD